jgi:nucleoside-diphosphate-sugar epimerase
VSESRDVLGYEPSVSLEDGLRRTAAYLLEGEEP